MFLITVEFELDAGRIDDFRAAMIEQARNSLEPEPDCLHFDVYTGPQRERRVFLYEIYRDRPAFERHLATPHFKAFDHRVRD